METITPAEFRKKLFSVLDQVAKGLPVPMIERDGVQIELKLHNSTGTKLENIVLVEGIYEHPDTELINTNFEGQWDEKKNL